jgi:tetratricopeptide (TPR) repeat protein
MDDSRLEILLQSLAESPRDNFTRYLVALEYTKLNRHEEAVVQFEQLLNEHPDYVPTYYQYAQLCENLGRNEDAIRIYRLGLVAARQAGDLHAASEIQAALDVLE